MRLYDLEQSLLRTLEDNKEDILKSEYPDDDIREFVDSEMPVYNSELLEIALDDLWLSVEEPEVYAFDGVHNAVNAIAGNLYNHLLEKANEWLENAKK